MRKIIFLFLILLALSTKNIWADCSSPAGVAGKQRFNNNTIEYCNGTAWKLIGAPQKYFGTTCGTVNEGRQIYNTDTSRMEYCKTVSSNKIMYVTGCSAAAGTCTNAGEQQYNAATNMMQFCNGTNWINMGSTVATPCCPDGFIPVPFDAVSGTYKNFCVSKYHMRAAKNSTGDLDANGDVPTGEIANYYPTSRPDARPWKGLSFDKAIEKCASLGANFHLITNQEWMTIAKSIENNHVNWSGGTVGSGYIPRGHNDGSPGHALAVNDTTDPCDGTGQSNCINTASPDYAQKRTLTLLNGQVIWDMAGNINSWVASNTSNESISYIRTNCPMSPCITQLNDTYNMKETIFPLVPPIGKYITIFSPFMYPPTPNSGTNKKAFLPANDAIWATPIDYGATPYDQRGFGMIQWAAPGTELLTDRAMLRGGYHSQLPVGPPYPTGLYSAFMQNGRNVNSISSAGFRCVYTPPN